MRPLYLSSAVREGLGPCLRPGGTVLTRRIIDLLQPDDACTILDAGCGSGASMALIKQHGFATVFGIDLDCGLLSEARKTCPTVARGDLARLPLAGRKWDIILCECTWNLTEKEQTIKEFARVLKPGGMLAMTDIYTRGGPA
ncbi:MAG: class I SAM-dependent methyltransferase, partial [Desulforhopalus sp.]|nr:class I SAM-dependent methyltransferase [Desulforhopalus sp.]